RHFSSHCQPSRFWRARRGIVQIIRLAVLRVAHRQYSAVRVEERDGAGESKRRSGQGKDQNLARQPAIRTVSGKFDSHERTWLQVAERCRSRTATDSGLRVHNKVDGRCAYTVAHRDLAALWIGVNDLAVNIGGRGHHTDPDVAREDVAIVGVEHGVNVNAIAFFQSKLSNFRSVAEDMRSLIK